MDHPVLIIEGNAFFQNMLRSIYRKLGLRTEIVGDLQAAADIMSRLPVSFVMLDAGLPGVAQGQTVPYLQSLSQKATAIILMITEHEPDPVGAQTSAQANGYLVKPFTENEIKSWLIANASVLLGHEWTPSVLAVGDMGSELEMEADPAAIDSWIEAIRNPEMAIAIDAIESLARNNVTRSIQPLIDFSYEAEGPVKIAVIRALGKLGDHSATEAIVANLNHSDQGLKESALEALGELRDPRALRPLSRILRVNDKKLVLMAIKALGMLRVPEAKEILGPLVLSGDAQIKANAQWAIRVIDGMDL